MFASRIKAHVNADGALTGVSGYASPDISLSTTPRFSQGASADQAVALVKTSPALARNGGTAKAKDLKVVGNTLMVNPVLPGGPPTMFICGKREPAKAEVSTILTEFGFDTEDVGAVEGARAIEPLCILWCIPGFRGAGWTHAFKLLKTEPT